MPQLIVEAIAPVGSWRPPEAMTFHRTYPLPPYTSLVGMMGAAMGVGLPAAFEFIRTEEVRLGVGGWSSGQMKDLWKIQKLGEKAEVGNAILLREHCVDIRLAIVFDASASAIASIKNAFERPVFPLTAGQSDSMLRVVNTQSTDRSTVETELVHSVMLYGELTPDYKTAMDLDSLPLTHSIKAPTVERIPTSFAFDESGNRQLASRSLVTFVADPITVPHADSIVGFKVDTKSSFLNERPLSCVDKPWIIPVHRF
jgi:CRISPR-associated protein Cas5t